MVIVGIEATYLRNRFLKVFVDKKSSWYQEILRQVQASNGQHYYGYLWDCLLRTNLKIVTTECAMNHLCQRDYFYVFWDNHPQSYFPRNSQGWPHPKNSLLKLSMSELNNTIQDLPEDCYFFDDSLSWALASTHEELAPGSRIWYFLTI